MGDGQPSDAEVIQRCRRGEVEPFSLLVERYQHRVYNLAFRLLGNADDALDAAQDAFVSAYAALSRFDPARPFAPWLFRIVTNACYGILRKRRPDLSFETMEEQEAIPATAVTAPEADPQQQVLRAIRDEEIQQAVLALAEPFRTLMLLRYMEEMSYEAIAAALELPIGTVKTYLHRARQRLRTALGEAGSDPADTPKQRKTRGS
jgi:RNA polymerase sigma-70 factor (ECF subfamily)